jgi:site-specific recombinase XerD
MAAAKAENSRRAYRSDWRQFESWCRSHGLACLPAVPETVALYLTALSADHKPSSLERKLTSITKAHQAAGFPTPARAYSHRRMSLEEGGNGIGS